MGKGQSYTPHQQRIIDRYYEHADTRTLQKLAELVSDVYVCTDEKKAEKLWATAEKALIQAKLKPARVKHIVETRDTTAFAAAVGELSG